MGGVGGYLPPAPCGLAGGLLTGGTAFADSFTRAGGRTGGTAFAEKLCCSPRGGWAVSGVGLGWCASLPIVHSSLAGRKLPHVREFSKSVHGIVYGKIKQSKNLNQLLHTKFAVAPAGLCHALF